MNIRVVQATGTVRVGKSIPSPQGTVRICISKSHSTPDDSREFSASDIVETPGRFSFNVAVNRQYRVWAEWGVIEGGDRTYLVGDQPIELEEIIFE